MPCFKGIFCKFGMTIATDRIMKKLGIIMLLAVLTSVSGLAQEIKWMSLEEALVLQKKSPKKILMDVYTNWCGPCKMLDKNTFKNPDVVDYVNKYFYAVKFNAEGDSKVTYGGKTYSNPNYKAELANRRNGVHQFTYFLKVNAYPTIVYFDEQGTMLSPIRGYQNPQQIELYLKMFKEDKHKEMKTQEDFNNYFTAFVPQFKNE
jgi:thioredoxin-related protein